MNRLFSSGPYPAKMDCCACKHAFTDVACIIYQLVIACVLQGMGHGASGVAPELPPRSLSAQAPVGNNTRVSLGSFLVVVLMG